MQKVSLHEVSREEDRDYDMEDVVTYHVLAGEVKVGEVIVAEVLDDDMTPDWIHCDGLEIFPAYRNQGYGTAALESLVDIYGRFTITPMNEGSQRLYERLGSSDLSWSSAYYTDQGYGVFEIS